jgi:hypothetical protein
MSGAIFCLGSLLDATNVLAYRGAIHAAKHQRLQNLRQRVTYVSFDLRDIRRTDRAVSIHVFSEI